MNEYERRELEPPATPLKRGDKGPKVRQAQEWLTLHGFGTSIDGDFGPATERAVHSFQWHGRHEEAPHWTPGVVTAETWAALTAQLAAAVDVVSRVDAVGTRIVSIAERHLGWKPREVGGPNSGPWVRLYMDGHEGKDWPWCAGFATYVLRQALGHDKWRTFSCDELAQKARRENAYVIAENPERQRLVRPGSLFGVRRAPEQWWDWVHCGIVTAVGAEHFETIEGNTNQGGSREGTEVCRRVRAFNARTDFVLLGGEAP